MIAAEIVLRAAFLTCVVVTLVYSAPHVVWDVSPSTSAIACGTHCFFRALVRKFFVLRLDSAHGNNDRFHGRASIRHCLHEFGDAQRSASTNPLK